MQGASVRLVRLALLSSISSTSYENFVLYMLQFIGPVRVLTTPRFGRWLTGLRDRRARSAILARIDRMADGYPGDWRTLDSTLAELRIHLGPGYRLYFSRQGNNTVILLNAGTKASQSSDISMAKRLAEALRS
ncbi:MAG: type II toxin-antitoxin system RelE/ParE family toxin [Gammaproteobacteria bacterium]